METADIIADAQRFQDCEWAVWAKPQDEDDSFNSEARRYEVRIVDHRVDAGQKKARANHCVRIRGYAFDRVLDPSYHLQVDTKIIDVPLTQIVYAERNNTDRRRTPFPHCCNLHGLYLREQNRKNYRQRPAADLGTFLACPFPGCDVGKWSRAVDSLPADQETRHARSELFQAIREGAGSTFTRSREHRDVVARVQWIGGLGRASFEQCRQMMEQLVGVASPGITQSDYDPELDRPFIDGRPVGQPVRQPNFSFGTPVRVVDMRNASPAPPPRRSKSKKQKKSSRPEPPVHRTNTGRDMEID